MKKVISIAMVLMMLLSFASVSVFAEDTQQLSANVYVTIADENGKLAIAQEKITVSDIDKDGALTINDALYCAHEEKFKGGAEKGYGSAYGSYGLSLTKLWGVENGVSYGYYVNNKSALSLTDVVVNGDYINAFIYTDLVTWSDTYCFFDKNTAKAYEGEEVTLTLSCATYDADYNPVTLPVKEAVITINGEKTEYITDAEGKVTIKIDNAGDFLVSATSETQTLVPPVCTLTVSAKAPVSEEMTSPLTGDFLTRYMYITLAIVLFAGVITALTLTYKKSNEK